MNNWCIKIIIDNLLSVTVSTIFFLRVRVQTYNLTTYFWQRVLIESIRNEDLLQFGHYTHTPKYVLVKIAQFVGAVRLKPVRLKSTRPVIELQRSNVTLITISPLVVVFLLLQCKQWFFVFRRHAEFRRLYLTITNLTMRIPLVFSRLEIVLDSES